MVGYKTRFIVNPIADKGRAGYLAEELRPMLDSFGEVEFVRPPIPPTAVSLPARLVAG
jgi:hypothetical protein